MVFGIQMYSIRDLAERDLKAALKTVAAQGYTNIEFAGFFGYRADEIKLCLDELGLRASGTHTGYRALVEDIEGQILYHKAIGCDAVIIPSADLSSREKIDEFISATADLQARLAKEGMSLSFHNHSHEFLPNADGSVAYDELVARTNLTFELDTFWAYAAGKNPIKLMEQLRARLRFIHIKDGLPSGEGRTLGNGLAPVDAVYDKAKEYGIPMIVESETLNPDGATECAVCAEWMKAKEA